MALGTKELSHMLAVLQNQASCDSTGLSQIFAMAPDGFYANSRLLYCTGTNFFSKLPRCFIHISAMVLVGYITDICVCALTVQFSSVTQSCPTLCNPMNCSTPGLPVHHQLPEFTQTYVHRVGDAIQSSHPLSSPSPPTLNLQDGEKQDTGPGELRCISKEFL